MHVQLIKNRRDAGEKECKIKKQNRGRRTGRWSRYYQSLRLMAADTDGGSDEGGGECEGTSVCVCV